MWRRLKQHNVRSIVFEWTQETLRNAIQQHAATTQALSALRTHGFRLGLLCEQSSTLPCKELHQALDAIMPITTKDAYTALSNQLQVPITRTLLVTDKNSIDDTSFRGLTTPFQPHNLTDFVNALFGHDIASDPSVRCFGPHRIQMSQLFFTSSGSFAMVNLKPIVPGHVLVVPKRIVDRFDRLDADEVADLWQTAQTVGRQLEANYNASSLTFAIQDGVAAGQTVPHVHIHILPRKTGDFEPNDAVYTAIEQHERQMKHLHMDAVMTRERQPRTHAVMAHEASELRHLFH